MKVIIRERASKWDTPYTVHHSMAFVSPWDGNTQEELLATALRFTYKSGLKWDIYSEDGKLLNPTL